MYNYVMKKFLILLLILIMLPVYSQDNHKSDIEILDNLGLLQKPQQEKCLNPKSEIKKVFKLHQKYTNEKNIEGLNFIYADKYINFDGFNKEIYLKLADKTWQTYRNLKYKSVIKDIGFTDDNQAIVEVEEYISGLSYVGTKYLKDGFGYLDSISKCIYILEKINGRWQIVSDNIFFENTTLNYGSAKLKNWELVSPLQVKAGDSYDIILNVSADKNSMVVATIGKEEVTYPQISAEEIFRNLSDDNTLQRVVKANSRNLNEYAVTFFVIMDTNNSNDIETLKMKVSGVGIGMNRVNIVPRNKYIKVEDEKNSKECK